MKVLLFVALLLPVCVGRRSSSYSGGGYNGKTQYDSTTCSCVQGGGRNGRDYCQVWNCSPQTKNAKCFPPSTQVLTTEGSKPITQLSVGDELLYIDSEKNIQKTALIDWLHVEYETSITYLRVHTAKGELRVSTQHLVWRANGDAGFVAAEELQKGDLVVMSVPDGGVQEVRIEKLEETIENGMYAPLTMSGQLTANGFSVSCYAHNAHQEASHIAMAPLRAWYKLKSWAGSGTQVATNVVQEDDPTDILDEPETAPKPKPKEGVHWYAAGLSKIAHGLGLYKE
eukprot:TRINITY_DN113624_c0_g1_i1.p1 TRINITY_DN113624_c0_g1~~TRINITY_DN113624_c0_g1_i1.p1  ORF type:complete len:284 (-),score=30.85 TRINITY_DN113624_c0_g1_i1:35-886(-)